ncbi:MAG TPA: efflux RND transporter periplasmic adaptor subunit [Candidatus Angelobacter sp.]
MHGLKLSRIIGLVIVLAAVAAFLAYRYRPRPVSVVLHTVERGRVARTIANTKAGSIKACRRSKLALPAAGQIGRIHVRKGEHVKQGQLLLELWNADAKASVRVAEEELNTARLHVHEICARADLAARDADRAAGLYRGQLIAQEQFDKVSSEARALRSQCDASQGDVQHSQARLKLAQAQLAQTVLTAPYAGRIGDVTGELGEFSTPSPPGIPTPPAIDLIDDSCYYVSAPIDEIEAGTVRVGMPAEVSIDAFPGQRFPGRVRRVSDYVLELEKQARTVEVEVDFKVPPDKPLVVGYSADIEITPEARDNVVRIPTQAILQNNQVLAYQPGSKTLEARTIKTGVSNWEYSEVLEGLAQGEQVVTSLDRAGVKAGARATVDKAQ